MLQGTFRSLVARLRQPASRRRAVPQVRPQLECLGERALPNAAPIQHIVMDVQHTLTDVRSDIQSVVKSLGSTASSTVTTALNTVKADLATVTSDLTSAATTTAADLATL